MPVYLFIARQSRDRMSGLTGCQAVNQQTSQMWHRAVLKGKGVTLHVLPLILKKEWNFL